MVSRSKVKGETLLTTSAYRVYDSQTMNEPTEKGNQKPFFKNMGEISSKWFVMKRS